MTHICQRVRSCVIRGEKGHTLVELVVATALGLLVTVAIVSLYASQRDIVVQLDASRQLSEAGQQALEIIAVHARLAGHPSRRRDASESRKAQAPHAIFGCANTPTTGTVEDDGCKPIRYDSDGITFRYAADTVSTWRSASGNPTDCLGQNVSDDVVVVRFFAWSRVSTRRPELYCAGNGKTKAPQPLVEGVERMVLRYWLPGAAESVRASSMSRDDWAHVAALDVCVVVHGGLAAKPVHYIDCEGKSVIAEDRRMRAAFRRRVALRNLGGRDSAV